MNIEPLTPKHDRQAFSCGVEALGLRLSEEIGMIGVVVDAKDEHARGWYERYEFERFADLPLTMWLPTAAIARL